MPRVRERKFDWDEARRLHDEGLTYTAIAAQLGVSKTAVRRVCDDDVYDSMLRNAADWHRGGRCPDCSAPTTRNTKGADHRCVACAAKAKATTARDGQLQCTSCRAWKPDDDFPHNRTKRYARRGRHNQCRACLTAAKRAYRERRKVPCARCGQPRLPANETGGRRRGFKDTCLCLDCYRLTLGKAV